MSDEHRMAKSPAVSTRPLIQRSAHTISYLLHPLCFMIASTMIVSYSAHQRVGLMLVDAAVLALGLLPGLAYIYVKTRQGAFSHYHLLLKEERYVVFPIMIAGLILVLAIYAIIGSQALIYAVIAAIVGGVGAALINRFWKISMHAAVAMGCAALLWPVSIPFMLLTIILALVSGLARLPIRHHTPAQVVVGWVYGFGFTTVLMYLLATYWNIG